MHPMIELHPKADALHGLGLPPIPYPVALPAFQAAVANDGELPLADMLHGLQLRAAAAGAHWQRLEPAMARLAELLAPDDPRPVLTAQGEDWRLDIGPVDLDAAVVAVQRDDALLAAAAARADGRLRVAAYRPLDARAIGLLLALARAPAVTGGTADTAGSDGLASLVHWPGGLGVDAAGREHPHWHAQRGATARSPACVVAELGTFHMLAADAG